MLLINMLIAMMTNTYTDISANSLEWLRQWSAIIMMMEQSFDSITRLKYQQAYSIPMVDGKRIALLLKLRVPVGSVGGVNLVCRMMKWKSKRRSCNRIGISSWRIRGGTIGKLWVVNTLLDQTGQEWYQTEEQNQGNDQTRSKGLWTGKPSIRSEAIWLSCTVVYLDTFVSVKASLFMQNYLSIRKRTIYQNVN